MLKQAIKPVGLVTGSEESFRFGGLLFGCQTQGVIKQQLLLPLL